MSDEQQAEAIAAVTIPHLAGKRSFLSAADILSADDIQFEDVYVVEWGGWVRVQAPTGTERDEFEDSIVTLKKELGKHGRVKVSRETVMKGARGKAAAIGCRNEQGLRIFTDAQAQQLGEKSAKALQRVFEVWMHLAGMTEDEIENLGNDSTRDQRGSGTSGSR